MGLVIGIDNFGEIIRNKFDFVDKTLFIKEIFDNASIQVELITRPRRFGKTLNLSMLHHFLASDINGQKTQGLFNGLNIETYKQYMEHQGKYPVIFMTMKEVKDNNFDVAYGNLRKLIKEVYLEHHYLLSSPKLYDVDKKLFESILELKVTDKSIIAGSLKDLTRYLYQHHGVKPWILIDEYDTPIRESYIHGYNDKIIPLIMNLFSTALKTNSYLERAVITGVLRLPKPDMLSGGLNNLVLSSIFNNSYKECFGFTEYEVLNLLKKEKLKDKLEEVRRWYNGYSVSNAALYNPYSIMGFIEKKKFIPYCINTEDINFLKTFLASSDDYAKKDLESILNCQSINKMVDEHTEFGDIYKGGDNIFSILLLSGYLKASDMEKEVWDAKYLLSSTNEEVTSIYRDIIKGWFIDKIGLSEYKQLLNSLTEGRVDEFYKRLKSFLLESSSMFDTENRNPEKFYHGFVLGLIVSLNETHIIESNKESGFGRYDVMIIPKDKSKLGLILEFKVAENELSLENEAKDALNQIIERKYEVEMKQNGIENILKLGLAFRGKEVHIVQA